MTFWDLADRLSYSVTFDGHPPSPPVLENPALTPGPPTHCDGAARGPARTSL